MRICTFAYLHIRLALPLFAVLLFSANNLCAQSPLANNNSLAQFLNSRDLISAHVGVYVYDDSSKKTIADYQSDKYFVPASNTKLFTLYAGMKYLGDSIEGIKYFETDTAIFVEPSGDPTFLHPDFQTQPIFDFLKKTNKKIYIQDIGWKENTWGIGWSWDDLNEDYSAERSPFPIYGNFIRWTQQNSGKRSNSAFEETATIFSSPEITWPVRFVNDTLHHKFSVHRLIDSNVFIIHTGHEKEISQDVPFITNNLNTAIELLKDTLGLEVLAGGRVYTNPTEEEIAESKAKTKNTHGGWTISAPPEPVYSRPVDSIFMPMMYRSDNFFAEQTLLMVAYQKTGHMKDDRIIDTLLNGPLSDLPQKPVWVDGSGLSRHNLFSPQDFVTLLIKCKNEFGMDRMKRVLPTGGKGTLKNYYHADSGYVFAKTGSMDGVVGISGYVYTMKKHLFEFSILVNNFNGSASPIRKEMESYIEWIRKNN